MHISTFHKRKACPFSFAVCSRPPPRKKKQVPQCPSAYTATILSAVGNYNGPCVNVRDWLASSILVFQKETTQAAPAHDPISAFLDHSIYGTVGS